MSPLLASASAATCELNPSALWVAPPRGCHATPFQRATLQLAELPLGAWRPDTSSSPLAVRCSASNGLSMLGGGNADHATPSHRAMLSTGTPAMAAVRPHTTTSPLGSVAAPVNMDA